MDYATQVQQFIQWYQLYYLTMYILAFVLLGIILISFVGLIINWYKIETWFWNKILKGGD